MLYREAGARARKARCVLPASSPVIPSQRRLRMRTVRTWLLTAAALLATAAVSSAQTTTGTIAGHVADSQGLALPGVTVSAQSPNPQGVRTVVTSGTGDYVFTLLPPGAYTITFDLSGFQR